MELNKEYSDRLISLFTLVEEYKYLMTNTKCPTVKNFFRNKFLENCRKVEEIINREKYREGCSSKDKCNSYNFRGCAERQIKEFTADESGRYDGTEGKPAYVAVNGIVYDVSRAASWGGGTHFGLIAGNNLTSEYLGCHGDIDKLANLPKVGIIKE